MDASAHGPRSAKLPVWDGQVKTFHTWWTRFQAYAMVYKFKQALLTLAKNTKSKLSKTSFLKMKKFQFIVRVIGLMIAVDRICQAPVSWVKALS